MRDILINTATMQSVIHCGDGAFKAHCAELSKSRVFVITDSNVYGIYRGLIEQSFGKDCNIFVLTAGEKSKNLANLTRILKAMVACGFKRNGTVVAFGGGVVGDIGGLASSLYMRGVNIVQVPTTLLSQVDSSVGGKTAIDFCGVKNVVGSFYQPRTVLVDPLFLSTLPAREIRCGLGEIIKYGALDGDILYKLLQNAQNLTSPEFLQDITFDCIEHKAEVVRRDEREVSGIRKTLNLGHTTGHAFELYYKRKSHGEFVLIGMYYELYIAVKKGICAPEYANLLVNLIKKVIAVPAYDNVEKACLLAAYDKKNERENEISIIVPQSKGKCLEIKLNAEEYAAMLSECAQVIKEGKNL